MNKVLRNDFETLSTELKEFYKFKDKTILVTGASGFLASYLIKSLLYLNKKHELNLKVLGVVRNELKAQSIYSDSEEFIQNNELVFIEQDIINPIKTEESIDYIIHSASKASPKYYGVDPVGVSLVNTIGTKNCLELAKSKKAQSILFFSSGEVYGNLPSEKMPITENELGQVDQTNVRSCYAESKRMGETLCVSYFHQFKLPVKIVRPFHTYGPGIDLEDGRVFCDFVKNIVHEENVVMKSKGKSKRAFCYVLDATIGFLKVLLSGENGEAYNVGAPQNCISIKELAETLISIYPEKKLKVTTELRQNDSYLESPIQINAPAVEKIMKLDCKFETSIFDGFKKTIESIYETR